MTNENQSEMSHPKSLRILMVEDSEDDALLIIRQFKKEHYDIISRRVETAYQMQEALEDVSWDLVLSDYSLPEFNAPSALTVFQKAGLDIPFIVVSGVIGEEAAVALMKAGANDYIMKNNLARLIPAVNRELDEVQTRREKQWAEERLKESEEQFRSIFENSVDAILLTVPDGAILAANPAACRMFGRSEEEICRIGRDGLVDYSDGRFFEATDERKRTGVYAEKEYSHIRKDGTVFPTEASSGVFTDKDGHERTIVIIRDITERKRAEENIKKAAEEWRTTFDSIEDMIMILDRDYRIIRVNKPVTSFLDLSYDKILGSCCYNLMHRIKQCPEECPFARMLNTKKHDESETYIDEKQMWISISVDPIFDNDGGVAGAVHIVKNITARKKAEEALRESEERYRVAIENSNDGIAIARAGKHLFVNRRFLEIFGYDRLEDVLKIEKHATVHPDDRERVTEINRRRMRGEPSPARYEFMGLRKDGTTIDIEASVAQVIYLGDTSSLIYFRDITEQKHAEEILQRSQQELQTIMDVAPVPVTWSDIDGNFKYFNHKFQELFGYDLDDIPTIALWKERTHPDLVSREAYAAQVVLQRERLKQGLAATPIETAIVCKDGSTRHVEILGVFAANKLVAMFNDVTEHKRMEKSLRENEKQLQTLLDNAPVAFTWSDMDGNFKYINKAFHKLFGYSIDDIPNIAAWKDIVHPDLALREAYDAQVVFQRERIKQGLAPTPIETAITCKDGSTRHVAAMGAVVSGRRMAIYTDLTERKQMEEALRNNQKEIQTIMDAAPVAIIWSDLQGNTQYINRAFYELFGYTLEEIPTVKAWKQRALPDPAVEQVYDTQTAIQIKRIEEQGLPAMLIETEIIRKDGTKRYVTALGAIAANRRMVMYSDITELKQMEEALRENEKKLQTLMDVAPIGISWSNTTGNIEYHNHKFFELFGYNVEDIPTVAEWRRLAYPDPAYREALSPLVPAIIEAQKQGKTVVPTEVTITCKDGSTRCVEQTGAMAYNRFLALYIDITERKQMEEELRNSQRELQIIMDAAPIAVSWSDAETNEIEYLNRKFIELFGYTLEDIPTMSAWSRLAYQDPTESKEFVSLIAAAVDAYTRGKSAPAIERTITCKDGSLRFIEIRGVIAANKLVVIFNDLTEQKRAEESLRESENKFRDLAEKSFVGIYLIQDNVFKYVNARFAEIHGYAIGELVDKKSILDLVPPEDVPQMLAESQRRIQEGDVGSSKHEFRVVTKEEGIKTVRVYLSHTPYQGKPAFLGTLLDITEQKHAEDALRESENKFRDLVEKSPVGVYLIQDGLYRYINARYAEIHGYAIEELVDKKGTSDTVLPEDMPTVRNDFRKGLKGDIGSLNAEFRIITKQREIKNVEAYGTYTMYRGKLAIIGILADVTERKQADEMLMDLLKDLEKKNLELENTYDELRESQQKIIQQEKMASIGLLAAGVAHEINNPVGFVMSNINSMGKYSERLAQFIQIQSEVIEKLSKQEGDTADVLDSLHKKRRALKIDYVANDFIHVVKESLEGAERVISIVQNLKKFSHKDENEHKPGDINEGIESTINVAWNELKYKANVKKEYGKIPLTKCNLGQLNQVFMNLLINAVQSIEEHGEILVKTERKDENIVVSISDSGSGISEDKMNRIFEPFFTTKEVGKGTGLGLSIAYDIVKKHKGEILVESEIGKGTTFAVIIPIVEC